MKKIASPVKKTTQQTNRPVDKVAAEFAEVKARKIPAKDLVWMFRFTAPNDEQLETAVAGCVEFLAAKLGNRCRVVLETATVGRMKFRDFVLKSPRMTPALLRDLDRGMAECGRRMKVKYYFLGYGEEVYKYASWKTLGTLFQPTATSVGDFDCRKLRFDGLYCHDLGEGSGYYLRFYRNGQCIFVCISGPGTVNHVARWFRRERKGITIGTYKVQGTSLSAVLEQEALRGQEPTVLKLRGRLTKQGLKVRAWSSYSKKESEMLYAFHKVKVT